MNRRRFLAFLGVAPVVAAVAAQAALTESTEEVEFVLVREYFPDWREQLMDFPTSVEGQQIYNRARSRIANQVARYYIRENILQPYIEVR